VMPLGKSRITLSRNDLKPDISNLFKFIKTSLIVMVEIFEILTKDFPFVKKKYNKLCYCHNYTTICSALIFLAFSATIFIKG